MYLPELRLQGSNSEPIQIFSQTSLRGHRHAALLYMYLQIWNIKTHLQILKTPKWDLFLRTLEWDLSSRAPEIDLFLRTPGRDLIWL